MQLVHRFAAVCSRPPPQLCPALPRCPGRRSCLLSCPATGPLSCCYLLSTLLRGTAAGSAAYTSAPPTPLHMADSNAVSSSDVAHVAQPPQLTELPQQSGKHSIVSVLAKPAYTFDGSNYGPWRCAFLEFLNAHGLRHHLSDSSPKESDPAYSKWSRLESAVCSWLISSVATQIMESLSMTRPARALWLKLETMYANKSNVSRTVRLYEELFACRQGTRTLQTYYGAVDAIFTNLELYQPLVLDLDTLRRYRDELRAGAFLSGLRPELADMIRVRYLGDPGYYPLRRSLQPPFECRTACPLPSPHSPPRLLHSSHQAGLPGHLGRVHLPGGPGPPIHPASIVGRRLTHQRSAGRSLGSLPGLWLLLEARRLRLCPRRTDHPRLLPRLREQSASPYLLRSWPIFRHHEPPHFVRPRHHRPVLRH